jgi:hypothetical protein
MVGSIFPIFSWRKNVDASEVWGDVFGHHDAEGNRPGDRKHEFVGTYPDGNDAHLTICYISY